MKKIFRLFAVAVAAVAAFSACGPKDIPMSYDGETVIEVSPDGGTETITLVGSREYTVQVEARKTWCTAEVVMGNTFTITVKPTSQEVERTAKVTVANGIDPAIVFTVKQQGGIFNFEPQDVYEITLEGGKIDIPLETTYEAEFTADQSWVKLTQKLESLEIVVPAATEAREATVSYTAGTFSGEFTIKQYKPVVATMTLFLEEGASYDKSNSVHFTIKGEEITAAAIVATSSVYFESNGKEYYENLLKTDSDFSLSSSYLTKINSAAGFTGYFSGLKPDTDEYVILYVSNGSSEKFIVDHIVTESTNDPLKKEYTDEDLLLVGAYEKYMHDWDVYSNGALIDDVSGSISERFGGRVNLGTATFEYAGPSDFDETEPADLIKVSGLVEALSNGVVTEDMYLHIYRPASAGGNGLIYFENPIIDFEDETLPAGQFYEFVLYCGYEGSNNYNVPYYPLIGGETEDGHLAFIDGGFGEANGIGALDHMMAFLFTLSGDINDPNNANMVAYKRLMMSWDLLLVNPSEPSAAVAVPMTYYKKPFVPENYVEIHELVLRDKVLKAHKKANIRK